MSDSKRKIPRIVVTGGPCAGKTTALAQMTAWLIEHGFQPTIVPEAATHVIQSGFDPRHEHFQELVLRQTLADEENRLQGIIDYRYKKPVLLCDRGIPDQLGYMDRVKFIALCIKYELSPVTVRDARYDGVIFLRSAAIGAEAFYSLESNGARYETLEEARLLDQRTLDAWTGCPHVSIISNDANMSFATKMQKTVAALARTLGVPEPLEQERKYRVTGFSKDMLPKNAVGIDIVQTYLVSAKGAERVRARGQGNVWVYFHTIKEPRGPGVSVERESIISHNEYESFLVRRDHHLRTIYKKRWCFEHKGHYCELDVFGGHLTSLVLLEIEYTGDPSHIMPPQFLGTLRDVTDDNAFSNFWLAKAA